MEGKIKLMREEGKEGRGERGKIGSDGRGRAGKEEETEGRGKG